MASLDIVAPKVYIDVDIKDEPLVGRHAEGKRFRLGVLGLARKASGRSASHSSEGSFHVEVQHEC